MDELLQCFLAWQAPIRDELRARGHWADAVDPRRGYALHGRAGARYSEAIAAQIFLAYPVNDEGLASVVVHPEHGSATYPVSFFTSAPLGLLQSVIARVCELDATAAGPSSSTAAKSAADTLLSVHDFTVAGSRRCAARAVTFVLSRGQHLLLTGPPGAGKSALTLAINGLAPLRSGHARWAPHVRVMFVPQAPIAAPGGTLASELAYPVDSDADSPAFQQAAAEMLSRVGMGRYLVEGLGLAHPSEHLSRGEMQCVAIARVLRHRPHVVVLDEALGAVPLAAELALLRLLLDAGVTLIMVSHRAEVAALAAATLVIDPALDMGWQLVER